jgi:adenylate cyclase
MTATRRLAAILAADVAGYSRLMGVDEEGTLARLKALRAELIDPAIAGHHGRIVKTTGDGLLVEFASVVDAMRCAIAWQAAMAERAQPADTRIEWRIGVNLGDVIIDDGDIFGDGVNIAARLEAMAEPGGICIERTVLTQTRGKLDFPVEDLGEQALKNIAQRVHVFRVLAEPKPMPEPAALPLPDKPSIAVLPFQNISGDPEQEYFADGMVEDITTALSKIRWFFVIARNSSFTYQGRAVDVKEVGRELGVRYVLEGSVRRSGNRLRITAQLVDAATGNHVWAERYDRDIADIFAVQDEITERVVAAIEPELYAAEHVRSQRKPPDSLDAWECVIRALSCIGQGTREGIAEAEALCRRAIAIAPTYGQPHSLLAWALLRSTYSSSGMDAIAHQAIAEVQAALAFDDRDPWAYLVQGFVMWRTHRRAEGERALRRALDLNPNFGLVYAVLAIPLATQGAHQDAVNSDQHALRLSPRDRLVSFYASFATIIIHFTAGDYVDCIAWARRTIEESPGEIRPHFFLVASLAIHGEPTADALTVLLRLKPDFSIAWVRQNVPTSGDDVGQRLIAGLRKAGVPEA